MEVKREPPPYNCFHKYWEYNSKYQLYSKLQDKHPRRKQNTLNSYFSFFFGLLPHFFLEPQTKSHCILFFIKCSRPQFSFIIKVGDTFVRRWGVSARSSLKGGGGAIKRVKAEVYDSKLKSRCLRGRKLYKTMASSL